MEDEEDGEEIEEDLGFDGWTVEEVEKAVSG